MYSTIDEFLTDWKSESDNTARMFRQLTDSSLTTKVTPSGRSLGRIAWHIVTTIGEMMGRTGLRVDAPAEDSAVPESASTIAGSYETAAQSLHGQIAEQWNNAKLAEEVDMYGQSWKNAFTLRALVRHEIHHRAQMSILLRQAGVTIPGMYGPSQEEWKQYGMDPQP
jgi:uncharacterized damage-inducible protein DinB